MLVKVVKKNETSCMCYKCESFQLNYVINGVVSILFDNNVKVIEVNLYENNIVVED